MHKNIRNPLLVTAMTAAVLTFSSIAGAQDQPPPPGGDFPQGPPPGDFRGGPPGGPDGFPGGGFPGMGQERKILKKYDTNADGWLNADERAAARKGLKKDQAAGGGQGGPGGPGGRRGRGPGGGGPGGGGPGGGGGRFGPPGMGAEEPVSPGPKVSPADVKNYPDAKMFEPTILRTFFIDFEESDWETELAEFHGTDVDVPCTLTVDGKKYPNVGVHFRGSSSYMMVGPGHKRSFNLAIDLADDKQRLYGVKTLNLLNSHEDPTFLSSILYSHIARQYIPTPKANFVKVVINGESWGVYSSLEQFNKDFLQDNYGSGKGARWKVKGSPMARSGLDYIGEDIEPYKQHYQIKSGDDLNDWKALAELCRVLTETPLDQLEGALKPMLDIDGALWFLALDVALVNCDGYWIRSSDYNIYRDPKGIFHIIPHDMNEGFVGTIMAPGFGGGPGGGRGGRGPGMRGDGGARPDPNGAPGAAPAPRDPRDDNAGGRPPQQPGGPPSPRGPDDQAGGAIKHTGIELDPLIGMTDATKPLRSRLLAVPSLRAKYLEDLRTIATQSLNWEKLGPVVDQFHDLIDADIKDDTRKLTSTDAFELATGETPAVTSSDPRARMTLRDFAEQRSKYLLEHTSNSAAADPSKGDKPAKSKESGQ